MALLNRMSRWVRSIQSLVCCRMHSGAWVDKWLPEVVGKSKTVVVRCQPFPCKQEANGGKRKYLYSDFGSDFRHELMDVHLSDWNRLKNQLAKDKNITVIVSANMSNSISVEIECVKQLNEQQFFSELADAIIDAMDKYGIQP